MNILPFPQEPITPHHFLIPGGKRPVFLKRERLNTRFELITVCYAGATPGLLPSVRTQYFLRDYVLMPYIAPLLTDGYNLHRLWCTPEIIGCMHLETFNLHELPVLIARYYRDLRAHMLAPRFLRDMQNNPYLLTLMG